MTKTRALSCCLALILTAVSLLSWAQPVSLNLKNADIRSVIDMVSGITGKNFIVDPRVKGKVTLVSSTPVEPDEVYDIFLSIMKVHGYVALEEGGVVNILPANEGVRGAPLNPDTGNDSQMQVQVVSVRNVKATQLVPALKPLVSKNGHLSAHASSNTLVISDTRRRLRRLIEIVRRLDVQEDSGLEAVKLEHAAASQVIKTLQPLLGGGGKGQNSVFGEGVSGSDIKLAADDRSNTVLMTGSKQVRRRLRALVKQMDTPIAHQGETRVVYLKFAKAVDLAEVLRNTLVQTYQANSKSRKNQNTTERQVIVQADEGMNALLITAGPDQHAEIQSVIQALDVRRAQVLVESLIVEMSDDKARSLGIQWLAAHEDVAPLSNASTLAATALQQGNLVGLIKAGKGLNIGVLARALSNDGDANILSTPSLITLDNAEAEINVGREVPFVTGSYTNSSGSSGADNPFTTIQRNDVGLTMKITPQINQGSTIRLDIDQEISNLLPGAAAQFGASDLVTSKRTIKTSVVVEDGNILVLGGLVDDTLRESQVKIPVLGDVPVLGQLFSYRQATKEKRNLMIFIRPKILRDAESSRALSEQRYAGIRDQQLEQYQAGSRLLSRDDIPLLEDRSPGADKSTNVQQPSLPQSGQEQLQVNPIPDRVLVPGGKPKAVPENRVMIAPVEEDTDGHPWLETEKPVAVTPITEYPVTPITEHRRPQQPTTVVDVFSRPQVPITYQHQPVIAPVTPLDRQAIVSPQAESATTMSATSPLRVNQIPDSVPVFGVPQTVQQDSSAIAPARKQLNSRLQVNEVARPVPTDKLPALVVYRRQSLPVRRPQVVVSGRTAPIRRQFQQSGTSVATQNSFGKTQERLIHSLSHGSRPSENTIRGISVPDSQEQR